MRCNPVNTELPGGVEKATTNKVLNIGKSDRPRLPETLCTKQKKGGEKKTDRFFRWLQNTARVIFSANFSFLQTKTIFTYASTFGLNSIQDSSHSPFSIYDGK